MDEKKWAFRLDQQVAICRSGEYGKVEARAEYVDGGGCARSDWFRADQLSYDNN